MRTPLKYNPLEQLAIFYYSDGGDGSGDGDGPGGASGGADGSGGSDSGMSGAEAAADIGGGGFGSQTDMENNQFGYGINGSFGVEDSAMGTPSEATNEAANSVGFDNNGTSDVLGGYKSVTERNAKAADVAAVEGYSPGMVASYNQTTGFMTIGKQGIFGISYDSHFGPTGKELGFVDEMAADVLDVLDISVTNKSIAATEEIASAIVGFAVTGFTFNVALSAIAGVANVANINGVISNETNSAIQLGVGVAALVGNAYGLASLGMQIGGPLGFGMVSLSGYGLMTGLQDLGITGVPGTNISLDNLEMRGDGNNDFTDTIRSNSKSFTILNNPLLAGKAFNTNTKSSLIKPIIPVIYQYKDNKIGDNKMTMNYMEYRGGLSNILAPHLINKNEGSVFSNIDIDRGTMKSIQKGTLVNSNSKKYKQYLDNNINYFESDYPFSLVKIGNFFYMTTENPNYNYVYRLVLNQTVLTEADLIKVDITAPTTKPTISAIVTASSYTVTASLVNIKDSSGNEETYTATVTSNYSTDIYNALINDTNVTISGTCSSGTPDGRTIIVTVEGVDFTTTSNSEAFSVNISDLSFLPEQLDRELWDTYQYCYTYYNELTGFESIPIFSDTWIRKATSLKISNIKHINDSDVDTIRIYRIGGYSSVYRRIADIPNLKDDSLGTYIDNIDDLLTIAILNTDNATDITGLKGLTEHKGTLFAFKNNQVYFSQPGVPNIWSEFNMVRVGGTVTGISSVPLGIIITTDAQQTYLLAGTNSSNFTLSTIAKSTGCRDYKSVNNIMNSAIWLDYEGIMVSVGAAVQNISKGKVDVSDIGDIYSSYVYNNIYYLCGSNYTLTIDFRYATPAFKKLTFGEIYSITKNNGVLHYIDSNLDEYSGLYSTGDSSILEYKSPAFIAQSYDILKEFNKINITYSGNFTYTIYVDNVEVASETISSDTITVAEVNVPTQYNQGVMLELGLVGSGEIYNFRYIFSYLNNN